METSLRTETEFERVLRSRGHTLPGICFGTGPLSESSAYFGFSVSRDRAHETIRAILGSEMPFLDTARNYGDGAAERWIGEVIRELGGLPKGALISTKLDRERGTNRFDGAAARRSLETSMRELGIDHFPILYLHDPEHARSLDEVNAPDGALRELMKMKEEGIADTIGLAAGRVSVMMPILRNWQFDVVLTHNRYMLLNRNAGEMIDYAVERGVAVINAGVMAGGVFAKGSSNYSRYVYQDADDETLRPVRQVEDICARHRVPTAAVALQFSTRDPRFVSTMVGVSRPERIAQTLELARCAIPDEVWAELDEVEVSLDDPEAGRTV